MSNCLHLNIRHDKMCETSDFKVLTNVLNTQENSRFLEEIEISVVYIHDYLLAALLFLAFVGASPHYLGSLLHQLLISSTIEIRISVKPLALAHFILLYTVYIILLGSK